MRVLLDECVPRKLSGELPGEDVRTVTEMGWSGIKNGPLLRLATQHFDAFLTVDQGLEYQQNVSVFGLIVVVMVVKSKDTDDIRPLVPNVLDALQNSSPGNIVKVQI